MRAGLSGNTLKIIAAIAMVIDHVGLLFFPEHIVFRIIGRLAFPIFAYMIAEGCRYTKNKLRYFGTVFVLAVICQIVYYFADNGSLYMCILVTFSLSILVIFALQNFKRELFSKEKNAVKLILALAVFAGSVWFVWVINDYLTIDYGFWGSMVPVWASLLQSYGKNDDSVLCKINYIPLHVVLLGVGLVLLGVTTRDGGVQMYALWALPVLFMYSGERGKMNMKYFFYVFYPVHLVILQGIVMLIG